ncbi:MAG: glycosyltransferase family 2 protein [Clostridiales bacterium]|nr:glycosyltransferase family 2 protein [Clostridiales bacterium]
MKLSILTATYNRGILLNRLYESIKENIIEGFDIEWLIMDDGSTDKTR